jgi:hypothetical protein
MPHHHPSPHMPMPDITLLRRKRLTRAMVWSAGWLIATAMLPTGRVTVGACQVNSLGRAHAQLSGSSSAAGPSGLSGLAQQDNPQRQQAKSAFDRGVALYAQGSYEQALRSFQTAYDLAPHPVVLVNLANCYEKLGRPVEAIQAYERFLGAPDYVPSKKQSKEVRVALGRLKKRTGEIHLQLSPALSPNAQVKVDGVSVTPDEDGRVRVLPGTRKVEVLQPGYHPLQREVTVAAGGSVAVSEVLASKPAPSRAAVAATSAAGTRQASDLDRELSKEATSSEGGGFHLSTPTAIAGAATLGLVAGAVVTGVMALSANSSFEDSVAASNNPNLSLEQREAARQDGLDQASRADTLALVTDVLIGAAIVGAGVTTYLFLTQDSKSKERDPSRGAGPNLSILPSVHQHGGGLLLRSSF